MLQRIQKIKFWNWYMIKSIKTWSWLLLMFIICFIFNNYSYVLIYFDYGQISDRLSSNHRGMTLTYKINVNKHYTKILKNKLYWVNKNDWNEMHLDCYFLFVYFFFFFEHESTYNKETRVLLFIELINW